MSDLPGAASPIRRPNQSALNFSARQTRQIGDEIDRTRRFETG
jgi:hypothetical protein